MTGVPGAEEIEDGLAASKALNESRPRRLRPVILKYAGTMAPMAPILLVVGGTKLKEVYRHPGATVCWQKYSPYCYNAEATNKRWKPTMSKQQINSQNQ